jgi:protein-L-isoaspartate(D-aspartate) O-methyltransferase
MGLPEASPFDGIIMAAAATHVPQALLDQLGVGGRMVMPLGAQEQILHLIVKDDQGLQETALENVKFVPLLMGRA